MRVLGSLRLKVLALLAILVALPVLVLGVLGDADAERRALLLAAVSDAGGAIGTALAAELEGLAPADIDRLPAALERFAGPMRSIRVLLRPEGGAADAFFLLAAAPGFAPEGMAAERRMLLDLGILPRAADRCDAPRGEPILVGAGDEVLTAVVTVAGQAGCWAVVIGTAEARLRGVADPAPYWQRPEARAAVAIYALGAALVALIFSGVWRALRRMERVATDRGEGFAAAADMPELSRLGAAFDAMVLRLRRSAEMLRQAAEANAHAFKGPIGTIRQALEPLRRDVHAATWLAPVDAALNRLDGLVRSARVLDTAAAELLEPELEEVDFSELAAAVVDGMGASHPGRVAGSIALGVVVRGQAEALETVLENLIENALGFSPAEAVVRVALRREGVEAVLTVEDDGPGVAPERLSHIFERYYSHRPGTAPGAHFGIGLWLVRQHVLLLGGAIQATNRAGGGLLMTVRLPVAG
jgi:two-component system sensor histidine kinase ChvG